MNDRTRETFSSIPSSTSMGMNLDWGRLWHFAVDMHISSAGKHQLILDMKVEEV
jgi:hypothetical protein